jgi:hypothetical protein
MQMHGLASMETGNAVGRTTLQRRHYAAMARKSILPQKNGLPVS